MPNMAVVGFMCGEMVNDELSTVMHLDMKLI